MACTASFSGIRSGAGADPERTQIPDLDSLPLPDREAIDHQRYLKCGRLITGRAASISSPPAAALIGATGVRTRCMASRTAAAARQRGRRDAVDRRALRARPGLVRRRRIHHQPSVAGELQRRAQAPRHPSALRDHHARRPLAERDAAAQLRELGCYRIWIGSESGSQRILDAMQRGVSVEQVRRACKLAQEHGIQVGMFLMWGYEGEEFEDIAATVEHVKPTNPEISSPRSRIPSRAPGTSIRCASACEMPIAWAEASDRDYVIAAATVAITTSSRTNGCATKSRRSASSPRTRAAPQSC